MARKRVLIVEDEEMIRRELVNFLTRRDFTVVSAQDIATARSIAAEESEAFDVVVLDMLLKSGSSDLTGADLGIELRQRWPHWPPEFIINSAYAAEQYFKLALNLGAAVYLSKGKDNLKSIVSHVRALTLRHSLSVQRPAVLATIQRIVAESRGPGEAIYRFCKDLMTDELTSCIGAPFVLLFTDDTNTYGLSDRAASLPSSHQPAYAAVQTLLQALGGDPLVLDERWLRPLDLAPDLMKHLGGAAFIPLLTYQHFRLSLGLLQDENSNPLAEDPRTLAEVLATFLSSAISVLAHTIVSAWNEASTVRRLGVLTATSQFCLYFGQEQLALLGAAEDAGEMPEEAGAYLGKLRLLAEDLRATGETLSEVLAADLRPGGVSPDGRAMPVPIAAVVREAWQSISQILEPHQRSALRLEGDCTVVGNRDYLSLAIERVLQWFAQRMIETPPDFGPGISVRCGETAEGSEILFEDRSTRLPDPLGQYLLMPFSRVSPRPPFTKNLTGPGIHMPLYLAKILIELGHNGQFTDRSGELAEEFGYRFVMSFPKDSADPGA